MTSFGYDILGFGVGSSRGYTSQVFTSGGTYTPSAGVTSALFMVFGARGTQPASGVGVPNGGGGGAYAEAYVSSLSSSYTVTLNSASTSSAGGASVGSTGNNNTAAAGAGSGDFSRGGGSGGIGSPYDLSNIGGAGCGGSRCGTGGAGANSTGTAGSIPNSGNEISGVFDLSPYGINFAYTRTGSGVPALSGASAVSDEEIALSNHCNSAASGSPIVNSGVRGWQSSSGTKGSVLIIEFF
tara:strand:+ start:10 stop:729 length:720 start_codon:yes stop_codon:yes gene_type:complete